MMQYFTFKLVLHLTSQPLRISLTSISYLLSEGQDYYRFGTFCYEYKIATLGYRHFDSALPSYLSAFLCTYLTSSTLRSSNEKLLKIPKRNRKSVGDHSSDFIASTVWNSLPASVRNLPTLSDFKAHLKTPFFNRHFHKFWRTMMCVCVYV